MEVVMRAWLMVVVVVMGVGCSTPATRGERAYWHLLQAGTGTSLASIGAGSLLGVGGVTIFVAAAGDRAAIEAPPPQLAIPVAVGGAALVGVGAWLFWGGYTGFVAAVDDVDPATLDRVKEAEDRRERRRPRDEVPELIDR